MTKGNVDHWETDDVVYSGAEDTDTASFSVVSEITHPVFKDGGGGRPRMGVSICRTARKIDREFYLRLMCRDGNVEEVRALHMLWGNSYSGRTRPRRSSPDERRSGTSDGSRNTSGGKASRRKRTGGATRLVVVSVGSASQGRPSDIAAIAGDT